MTKKKITQAIADVINKWGEKFIWFERAHANLDDCRVLWMNGSFIGPFGWAYCFAMVDDPASIAKIIEVSSKRYGVSLSKEDIENLKLFCVEMKETLAKSGWKMDSYDHTECCFFN